MEEKDLIIPGKEVLDLFNKHKKESSGFEGLTQDAFKMPFIKILEDLSPEVKHGAFRVEGARPGMFFNTATHEISEKIQVIVLKVKHSLLAWAPKRAGFRGEFEISQEKSIVVSTEKNGFIKYDKDNNLIQDTLTFFLLNANDMQALAAMPLAVTRFKDGQAFNSRLLYLKCNGEYVGVTWAAVWELGLVEKTNDQGTWNILGNTPEFIRFVTEDEINKFILPALEGIKDRVVNYNDLSQESEGAGETEKEEW